MNTLRIETSVTNDVLLEAESLAKRMGVSKSELFRQALVAFIKAKSAIETMDSNKVRERLDEVYSQESSEIDEALLKMQWVSLPKEDW